MRDNFVINAHLGNEEGCDFYVECYGKPIFKVGAARLIND